MQPSPSAVRGGRAGHSPRSPPPPAHQAHSWARAQRTAVPKVWATPGGHTRQPRLRYMARAAQGGCLPGGSVSSWPACLCTTAGYVMVSLLLCSFRTTARPVLDKRTAVTEEKRSPPGHVLTAVRDWPEASRLRKGTGQRPETHLQWGHRLAVMCVLQKQEMSLLLLSQTFFTCWKERTTECHLKRTQYVFSDFYLF